MWLEIWDQLAYSKCKVGSPLWFLNSGTSICEGASLLSCSMSSESHEHSTHFSSEFGWPETFFGR
jgi:hypothetical protein